MPKQVIIQVNSMDAELQFSILPSTTGLQLFDQVMQTLSIREKWYFGLKLDDKDGKEVWLNLSKRVMYQIEKYLGKSGMYHANSLNNNIETDSVVPPPPVATLKLLVKLFPEDVEKDVIQDVTLKLFYLQVKDAILNDRVNCPYEVAVLLASYAFVVRYGDYDDNKDYKYIIFDEKWIPDKILSDYPSLSREQWKEITLTWYKQHKSMIREDAMLEYLKVAQDLEMYGVASFDVTNKNNNDLVLGVYCDGLKVYSKDYGKLDLKLGFPFSEIRRLSSHQKKFIIKTIDKHTPEFTFFSPDKRTAKTILKLCMDYHNLFMRRQKAESMDVNQLRLHAAAEKNAKLAEREALQMERVQRREIERENEILESKLQKYQSQYHLAVQELEHLRESSLNLHRTPDGEEHLHDHVNGVYDNDDDDEEEKEEDDEDNVDRASKHSKKVSTMKILQERKILKDKIETLRRDIEDEKKSLSDVLNEKSTLLSQYKAEKLKNYFNKYSTAIFNTSTVAKDYDSKSNSSNFHEFLQSLSKDLLEARERTHTLRNDLAEQQRHNRQILNVITSTIMKKSTVLNDDNDCDNNDDGDGDEKYDDDGDEGEDGVDGEGDVDGDEINNESYSDG